MSDHTWVQENIATFLSGGLTAAEQERFDRHVGDCAPCQKALAHSRKLEHIMDNLFGKRRPGADLEDRAILRLRNTRTSRPGMWRFFASAAAVVLLALLGAAAQEVLKKGGLAFPGTQGLSQAGPIATGFKMAQQGSNEGFVFANGSTGTTSKTDELADFEMGFKKPLDSELKQAVEPLSEPNKARPDVTLEDRLNSMREKAEQMIQPGNRSDSSPQLTVEKSSKAKARVVDEKIYHALPVPGGTPSLQTKALENPGNFYFESDQTFRDMRSQALTGGGAMPGAGLDPSGQAGGAGAGGSLGVKPSPGIPVPSGDLMSDKRSDDKQLYYSGQLAVIPLSSSPAVSHGGAKARSEKGEEVRDPSLPVTQAPAQTAAISNQATPSSLKPVEPTSSTATQPKKDEKKPEAEPTSRKIIRSGDMEFVIDSFDGAVETVGKLITSIKGAFIATVNSDKLPNGKMRGSVVVRMPPQFLDKFVLDLRRDLAKSGELINQKVGSLDVTKQYYDVESRLKAARTMEDRLIRIIKDGKGEIKDLLAAERELGVWRTKIEEMEGEIRYFSNQVALSTLTISLSEKEIQAPSAFVVKESIRMQIEADDVEKAYQAILSEVATLKGRVTKSDLKQHTINRIEAIIFAEVAPGSANAFRDFLKKVGFVRDHVAERTQHAEGGTGRAQELKPRVSDVVFQLSLKNLTALVISEKVEMRIEVDDVEKAHQAALVEINAVKGRVTGSEFKQLPLGQLEATVHAEVAPANAPALRDALKKLGIVRHHDVQRSQQIEGDAARPQDLKQRYKDVAFDFVLNNTANVKPRDTFILQVAANNVPESFRKLQAAVAQAKGLVRNSNLNEQEKVTAAAQFDFDIPIEARQMIDKLLADVGQLLTRNNAQVPLNELSTDRKVGYRVTLNNAVNIKPRESFDLSVATPDVFESDRKLKEAVAQLKGYLRLHHLNEKDPVNTFAQFDFDVPASDRPAIDKILSELGQVLARSDAPVPVNELSTDRKVGYRVTLSNAASIRPRESFDLKIATLDVSGNQRKLQDAVNQAKGRVLVGKSTDSQDKHAANAQLDFDIPAAERGMIDKLLGEIGQTVSRNNNQVPINEIATDRRIGYRLLLVNAASIPPREKVVMRIEVKEDVKSKAKELSEMVRAAKGSVDDAKVRFKENGQMTALLKFDVPLSAKESIVRQIGESGKIIDQDETRNPQVPDNELAIAHIDVLLSNEIPIVPRDEGLWNTIRTSLYYSFTIFSWSISLVILGLSVILPWAVVIWIGIRLTRRWRNRTPAQGTV